MLRVKIFAGSLRPPPMFLPVNVPASNTPGFHRNFESRFSIRTKDGIRCCVCEWRGGPGVVEHPRADGDFSRVDGVLCAQDASTRRPGQGPVGAQWFFQPAEVEAFQLRRLEALNGLLLIGWSASFTFVSMDRFWSLDRPPTGR